MLLVKKDKMKFRTFFTKYISVLLLLILITIALLFFSAATSPLYPNCYLFDSAYFRFIGSFILKGKTLYKDIWDHKGPILFFIQAIGALNGIKNTPGSFIFFLQIVSLFTAIRIIEKLPCTIKPLSRNPIPFILSILCFLSIFCKTMEYGNLSEEWSLPFISCSLYLMIKFASNTENNTFHPYRYAFIHGVCFSSLAFIRVNNAISICIGSLIISIFLIKNRQWKNLFINIASGISGIALITIPLCIYFRLKNALYDMLNATFFFNMKYSEQSSHQSFTGVNIYVRYLPIGMAIMLLLLHIGRNRRIKFVDILLMGIVAANSVILQQTNIYLHYFTIFLPVLCAVIIYCFSDIHIPELCITVAILFFFLIQDIQMIPALKFMHDSGPQFPTSENIPKDERISSIAFNVNPGIYLNTGIEPCSRFAAYQYSHFPVEPKFADEFIEAIHTVRPIWIIRPCRDTYDFPELQEIMDNEYHYEFNDPLTCYYRQNR